MSASWSSEEGRVRRRIKPVERPRGSHAVTFFFTLLQPVTVVFLSTLQEKPMHAATRKHPYRPTTAICPEALPPPPPPLPHAAPTPRQLNKNFFDILAKSCASHKHAKFPPAQSLVQGPTHFYHKARRRHHDSARQFRCLHGETSHARPPRLRAAVSREEYINLVDIYRETFSTQAIATDSEPFRLPSDIEASWATGYALQLPEPISTLPREALTGLPPPHVFQPPSLISELPRERSPEPRPEPSESSTISESMVDPEPPESSTKPEVVARSQIELDTVDRLVTVLNDNECTHEKTFEAYSTLPFPGVSYLSDKLRRLLFRRLSVMKRKNKDSMVRYLSVVDDMKAADLPMTEAEWNSAIAFCGQCYTHVSAAKMESALRTWKEMEQEAGVQGGKVTFNILFDMAAKAGKFALAEMILKEMEARNLGFNRYFRTSYILYQGLKADGDGVRRAYREFVEAGEVVNTVVLNLVITSLIRAGEPAAAEQVYERMRHFLANYTGETLPHTNWKEKRSMGRLLDRAARNAKNVQQLRDEQVLVPDLSTFAIFMEHHVSQTGEFLRVVALLSEMQQIGVPMHGRIFTKIFKGFATHGGKRYSKWTRAHLDSVWKAWWDAMDHDDNIKIWKWSVVWSVKAFERCAGQDRALEVWGELRRRWEPGDGQVESAMYLLKDVLKADLS